MPTTSRRVKGAGLELAVTERGTLEIGPTIVLVHGFPDTSAVWDPVADVLAERHHVVTYDVRGSGASDAPERTADYRLDLLLRDLAAVIDATSPDRRVHLVGHDWGSIQGWAAVISDHFENRVASYTSISAPPLDHAGLWMRERAREHSYRKLASQAVRSSYIAAFHLPGAPRLARLARPALWRSALRREGAEVDERWPAPTFARDLSNGMRLYRANVGGALRRPCRGSTMTPVQLVVALRDRFVPPALLEGLDDWPDSGWRREIDAGHWVVRSHPEEVARFVADLVGHVEGGPATALTERGAGPTPT